MHEGHDDAEGQPVKIGLLQRYAIDNMTIKDHPFQRAPSTGKKIAVVGAGPAGLSCAHRLAMLGNDVVTYEAKEKSSGLNEFGIAHESEEYNGAWGERNWGDNGRVYTDVLPFFRTYLVFGSTRP